MFKQAVDGTGRLIRTRLRPRAAAFAGLGTGAAASLAAAIRNHRRQQRAVRTNLQKEASIGTTVRQLAKDTMKPVGKKADKLITKIPKLEFKTLPGTIRFGNIKTASLLPEDEEERKKLIKLLAGAAIGGGTAMALGRGVGQRRGALKGGSQFLRSYGLKNLTPQLQIALEAGRARGGRRGAAMGLGMGAALAGGAYLGHRELKKRQAQQEHYRSGGKRI